MLFNSIEFLLVFLPVTLLVYLRIRDARLAIAWLSFASLVFYGYWNPVYLLLILASISGNYALGKLIIRSSAPWSYWVTAVGVALNLGLLGYFKYANFFVSEIASFAGLDWSIDRIILPLAISFFTFQQIAYLVDAHQGKVARHGLVEYIAFVTFFPQLIAGPIVHQRDMLPQFRAIGTLRKVPGILGIGLTIFAIGLFKKVAIADELAIYANPMFDAALAGTTLSIGEAWTAALAYTFQLYFDFSGYSDMAIGLGQMFGITLPVNFASPYKARNIIDFWRAWHITLSRFLRDYLYIPLGGNRFGTVLRYRNLLITMVLGGLWHGAAWSFVLWGTLHGLYLTANHLWRRVPFYGRVSRRSLYGYMSWTLTLLCVVVGWVFFRAESVEAALSILQSMAGLNGIDLPVILSGSLEPMLGPTFTFEGFFPNVPVSWRPAFFFIVLSALLAMFAPNVFDLFQDKLDAAMNSRVPRHVTGVIWKPDTLWAALAGAMLAYCLLSLSEPTEFLYFQF